MRIPVELVLNSELLQFLPPLGLPLQQPLVGPLLFLLGLLPSPDHPLDPVARNLLEFPVSSDPQLWMNLVLAHLLDLQQPSVDEVVMHGLLDDLGHVAVGELDKSVVFTGACLLVARDAEAGDLAELGEVRFDLFFEESFW